MTRSPAGRPGPSSRWYLFGTPEPVLAHRSRLAVPYFHAVVVKLPEEAVLEEVGLLVSVLEDGVNVAGDPLPHAHVPGVVQLDVLGLFVEAPVHGACIIRCRSKSGNNKQVLYFWVLYLFYCSLKDRKFINSLIKDVENRKHADATAAFCFTFKL